MTECVARTQVYIPIKNQIEFGLREKHDDVVGSCILKEAVVFEQILSQALMDFGTAVEVHVNFARLRDAAVWVIHVSILCKTSVVEKIIHKFLLIKSSKLSKRGPFGCSIIDCWNWIGLKIFQKVIKQITYKVISILTPVRISEVLRKIFRFKISEFWRNIVAYLWFWDIVNICIVICIEIPLTFLLCRTNCSILRSWKNIDRVICKISWVIYQTLCKIVIRL